MMREWTRQLLLAKQLELAAMAQLLPKGTTRHLRAIGREVNAMLGEWLQEGSEEAGQAEEKQEKPSGVQKITID